MSTTPMSEHPPNSDIYVDTKRGKPGDHVLFKADWRVSLTSKFNHASIRHNGGTNISKIFALHNCLL